MNAKGKWLKNYRLLRQADKQYKYHYRLVCRRIRREAALERIIARQQREIAELKECLSMTQERDKARRELESTNKATAKE